MSHSVCQLNRSPGITEAISELLCYLSRTHLQKLINGAPLLTHADLALLV